MAEINYKMSCFSKCCMAIKEENQNIGYLPFGYQIFCSSGVTQLSCDLLRLYRTYFAHHLKRCRKDSRSFKENISDYYLYFLRLIFLQCFFVIDAEETGFSNKVLNIIKWRHEDDQELRQYTQRQLSRQLQEDYTKFKLGRKADQTDNKEYQIATSIKQQIKKNRKILLQKGALELINTQYPPLLFADSDNIDFIKVLEHTCKIIQSVVLLNQSQKKSRLRRFNEQNNLHTQTSVSFDSNGGWLIKMAKKYKNSASYEQLSQYLKRQKKKLQEMDRIEICKKLLRFFDRFYKNSGFFYPILALSDILINKQTRDISVHYQKLIYEALALNKYVNLTNRIEYQDEVDLYICFKEENLHDSWQLQKEYYCYSQTIAERIKNTQQLKESIHVWRLCCICYFILHSSHLIIDAFKQWSIKQINSEVIYFQSNKLKSLRQTIYIEMESKTNYFDTLFFKGKFGYPQIKLSNHFKFTKQALKKKFNIVDKYQNSGSCEMQFQNVLAKLSYTSSLSLNIIKLIKLDRLAFFVRLSVFHKQFIKWSCTCFSYFTGLLQLIQLEMKKNGDRRAFLRFSKDKPFLARQIKEKYQLQVLFLDYYHQSLNEKISFSLEDAHRLSSILQIYKLFQYSSQVDESLDAYQHSNNQKNSLSYPYRKNIIQMEITVRKALQLVQDLVTTFFKNQIKEKLNQLHEIPLVERILNIVNKSEQKQIATSFLFCYFILSWQILYKLDDYLLFAKQIISRLIDSSLKMLQNIKPLSLVYLRDLIDQLTLVQRMMIKSQLNRKVKQEVEEGFIVYEILDQQKLVYLRSVRNLSE